MLLSLKDIDKDYLQGSLRVPVLKKVQLAVDEGDYLAIMGPSGSGKTTLMNIIGCLDRATQGSYLFDGEDVAKLSENELSDMRLNKIGFVFQNFQLLPGQTALENVALPLIYAGVKKDERKQRALEALKKVGLEERASFKPSQLSGGQKQRVAIARAIVNKPKLLLADEPTGALDQASGKAIMTLFEDLNKQGITIIMITHDKHIASYAHQVAYIVDGEMRQEVDFDAS